MRCNSTSRRSRAGILAGVAMVASAAGTALAQGTFTSGSDGSDGPLDFTGTPPGVVVFDPASFDPPLDADGDGIYHFTTITIPEGVTVKLTSTLFGGLPGYWLATGDVLIDGTVDVSGEDGHDAESGFRRFSIPGPGGFGGGPGHSVTINAERGLGPGGGYAAAGGNGGGTGGSYAQEGRSGYAVSQASATDPYGNPYLQPLLGGSGGGGGSPVSYAPRGGGGGAGGGAILIASSTRITLNGMIIATGGDGGRLPEEAETNPRRYGAGGGGSGGAIRLIAPSVDGNGTLDASGGDGWEPFPGGNGAGSEGYIRVETRTIGSSLQTVTNGLVVPLSPATPILPADAPSAVRITTIAGEEVDIAGTGSIINPDVILDNAAPVEVGFEASGIPVGTQLRVLIFSPELGQLSYTSTPLQGTLEQSTATATIQFPPSVSQMYVRAMWTP